MKSLGFGLSSFILILVALTTCNTTEPPPPDIRKLTLTFEDASCTEAWITLTTENLQLPAAINILGVSENGDSVSRISNLSTQDTLLYIDSLLPDQTYSFHAVIQSSSHASNELSVTTMDTTSHNFTWQSWTFGTIGSSTLYDVAIIDENNIWAVGEINIADTSENGFTLYNAAHWDGSEWTLHKIMFHTICGQQHQNAYAASSIIAFSENEIWVAQKGDQLAKIENGVQTQTICMPWTFSINKIWGTSSNDLYIVGNNGNIARYYNGSQWTLIESGTNLNINDIWGDYNEKTDEWEILVVAANKFFNEGNTLLSIDGLTTTKLSTSDLPWSLSSIWLKAGKKYFVGGDGLYFKRLLNQIWKKDSQFIPIYKDRIRGTNFNNIAVSGSNGLLSHFNGFNWKHYINSELPFFSGRLLSCDLKGNVTIAVGWKDSQSIITLGKK